MNKKNTRGKSSAKSKDTTYKAFKEKKFNKPRAPRAPRAPHEDYVVGIHPVEEALKSGRTINKIMVAKGRRTGKVHGIIELAKEQNLVIQEVGTEALKRISGDSAHQGVAAYLSPYAYLDIDAALNCDKENCLILALNDLTDTHNFGSILRTCDATGVDFVIIPERRSVQVNATVTKTAAGAVEHVKIIRVKSLGNAIESLKKAGYWVVGADMKGEGDYTEMDYTGKKVLVSGAEDKGLSPHIRRLCDYTCYIPMVGRINSLNVSVATSLLLYEWRRQIDVQDS